MCIILLILVNEKHFSFQNLIIFCSIRHNQKNKMRPETGFFSFLKVVRYIDLVIKIYPWKGISLNDILDQISKRLEFFAKLAPSHSVFSFLNYLLFSFFFSIFKVFDILLHLRRKCGSFSIDLTQVWISTTSISLDGISKALTTSFQYI